MRKEVAARGRPLIAALGVIVSAQDSFFFGARNIVIYMIVAGIGGMFLFSQRSWDVTSEADAIVPSITIHNDGDNPVTFWVEEIKRYPAGVVTPRTAGSAEVPGTGLYTVKAIGEDGFVLSEQQISVIDSSGAELRYSEEEGKWNLDQ